MLAMCRTSNREARYSHFGECCAVQQLRNMDSATRTSRVLAELVCPIECMPRVRSGRCRLCRD